MPMCELIHEAFRQTVMDPGAKLIIEPPSVRCVGEAECTKPQEPHSAPTTTNADQTDDEYPFFEKAPYLAPDTVTTTSPPMAMAAASPEFKRSGTIVPLFEVDKKWIIDSGCGKDLVSISLAQHYDDEMVNLPTVKLHTAAGITKSTRGLRVEASCGDISIGGTAQILDDTPSVLSMGKKCPLIIQMAYRRESVLSPLY